MKNTLHSLVLMALLLCSCSDQESETLPNTLSPQEKEEGWKLLFDGMSTSGWRGAYKEAFPEKGWEVRDGMLAVQPSGGRRSRQWG